MGDLIVIARCPVCGWVENPVYASDGRCRGVPNPHPVAWLKQVEAVSLADACELLRSATRWEPGTGRDRHVNGWRAAADELERHFGGR